MYYEYVISSDPFIKKKKKKSGMSDSLRYLLNLNLEKC